MKDSADSGFVEEGTLERPKPIGRAVRFCFGAACLYGFAQLIGIHTEVIHTPFSSLPDYGTLALGPLLIINYVVNIGFGQSWGQKPRLVSASVLALAFLLSWLMFGSLDHLMAGVLLWAWLAYFYLHLGLSFVLASCISTPGCEMRAIPELIGRIRGKQVKEHRCPVPLLTRIDEWEARRT